MACELDELLETVSRIWGFQTLRPLQERAISAVLNRRDSLVVMPTGGGKSLCYQAPAVHRGGTTVVISPLIALMKDQVDALNRVGVPAVRMDSSLTAAERNSAENAVRQGRAPIVFVSPERLAIEGYAQFLAQPNGIQAVAIDEAHCISHWGHDFRPEYRQLLKIHEHFPGASIHAYTATATEKVRADIVKQLGLRDPELLVGNFDRPNLTYRVEPRVNLVEQVREVIARHPNSAGIVYCLRRADVESLANSLAQDDIPAFAYHAGMSADDRRLAQDKFTKDDAPVVCATIAFGMGIDPPDVRFVIHGAMPKSIEHYQQETGRAGRDGFPAECTLFYSSSDAIVMRKVVQKSATESGADLSFLPAVFEQLDRMDGYCRTHNCRHRSLVQHFGQQYEPSNCGACDICLGDMDIVPDGQIVAQKILSCVARVKESFGIGHVSAVLRGENTEALRTRGHDQLTTFGLLKGVPKPTLRDWMTQLIGQEVLVQTVDEYPILKLNPASWEVMRGTRTVRLVQLSRPEKISHKSPAYQSGDRGPNGELFEILRDVRKQLAQAENVPAYRVFPDSVLTAMATTRPEKPEGLRQITGVGEVKFKAYGDTFLNAIRDFNCQNPRPNPTVPSVRPAKSATVSPRKAQAFELFRQNTTITDAAHQMKVTRATVCEYLAQYIEMNNIKDISVWISSEISDRVKLAIVAVGKERLKPIFEELHAEVSYEDIRLVVATLK